MGFPDVCLTPAAPAPVPIPYPNLAMNAMAVPFSPNVFVGFMPSLNMAAKIPMTSGDDAGTANPLFKQMGQTTMGNPIIFVNCMPANNMLVPTTGNLMNNPIGAALVPSISTTLYTDGVAASELKAGTRSAKATRLSHETWRWLRAETAGDAEHQALSVTVLGEGMVQLRIRRFVQNIATRVFNRLNPLRQSETIAALIIDLRANHGGDTDAALELADDFVSRGTVLAYRRDEGDDEVALRARHPQAYLWPVAVLVDEQTASAAELFAGSLQANGRAVLVGEPTHGKGTAQRIIAGPERPVSYATVASFTLTDGQPIDGRGLQPDVPLSPNDEDILDHVVAWVRTR